MLNIHEGTKKYLHRLKTKKNIVCCHNRSVENFLMARNADFSCILMKVPKNMFCPQLMIFGALLILLDDLQWVMCKYCLTQVKQTLKTDECPHGEQMTLSHIWMTGQCSDKWVGFAALCTCWEVIRQSWDQFSLLICLYSGTKCY